MTGGYYVGGLVGQYSGWDDEPHIRNCYAVGQVTILTSSSWVGGLVGEKSAGSVIINSYYDSETPGQSDTGKGAPKTTEQMMQKDTFKYFRSDPLQGMVEISWEFDTIWDIDEGYSYPFLRELPNPYK